MNPLRFKIYIFVFSLLFFLFFYVLLDVIIFGLTLLAVLTMASMVAIAAVLGYVFYLELITGGKNGKK